MKILGTVDWPLISARASWSSWPSSVHLSLDGAPIMADGDYAPTWSSSIEKYFAPSLSSVLLVALL